MTYGYVHDHADLFDDLPLSGTIAGGLVNHYINLPSAWSMGTQSEWSAEMLERIMAALFDRFRDELLLYPANEIGERIYSAMALSRERVNKLIDSAILDYNPIENYRMTEEGKDTREASVESTANETSGTSASSTSTASEYPFNAAGSKRTVAEDRAQTETSGGGQKEDTRAEDETTTHKLTRSGNIGVTTSQQMIQSEREIAVSAIDWIVEVMQPFFLMDEEVLA